MRCDSYFANSHKSANVSRMEEGGGWVAAHPVPLIHRMPPALPSILHRSDRGHSGTGDTAQLRPKMSVRASCVEGW